MELIPTEYGLETPGGITGFQEAPVRVVSPYEKTYGPQAVKLCSVVGINLDPWQQNFFRDTLGIRHNMKWAARNVGLVVARQNGKSELAAARIIIGLYVLKEKLIIYSAHRSDTAHEIFQRVQEIIDSSPELSRRTAEIRKTNGQESVRTKDGCRVQFRTRVKNAGRGFSCDCLILDEAMDLSRGFIGDVYPVISARSNPQVIYMGSAGSPESEAFGDARERALGDDPGLMTWLEWSADVCTDYCSPGCTEHDPIDSARTYAKTNPAYGIRISHEAVEDDRRTLDPAEFLIERLSVGDWPKDASDFRVISSEAWERQADGLDPIGDLVFAVTTAPDRRSTCITVAGWTDPDKSKITVQLTETPEGIDQRAGTRWVVDRIVDLWERWSPSAVVIDTKGQAGTFIPELEEKGVKVISPKAVEYAQACADFAVGITGTSEEPANIWHRNQVELTLAVAGADKRNLSGLWAWARASDTADIIALESATLAVWGLKHEAQFGKEESWFLI